MIKKAIRAALPAGLFLFAACSGLLFFSCASGPDAYKAIDAAVANNDFEAGIEEIIKGQERSRPIYPDKNVISLFMDKGLLEHYAGRYGDSSQSLERAERLIEEAFTRSITAEIGTYILNDNTREYPGEDFEDIYINVFNALNYYNNNNIEGALVEIRKLTVSSGKLDMLSRKYEDANKKADEWGQGQLDRMNVRPDQAIPKGEPVNFSNSALARYLSTIFYYADGRMDSARIEYDQIYAAFAANPNIYYHQVPSAVTEMENLPRDQARLDIIAFSGLSPIKKEEVKHMFFPFFRSPVLWRPSFKLPVLVRRPSRISHIEVIVDGGGRFTLELLEDIGAVIEETFKIRRSTVLIKTYIRTFVKYAAADVTAAMVRENSGEVAALLSAVGAKTVADATEGADIRMSRYLPDKAYVGSINLDPGTYTVTVNFLAGGSRIASSTYRDLNVRMNRLNLVEAFCLR